MSNQTFNRSEIQDILRKASEIQTQKELYADKDGLTREELIELAKEVGIDKDSLLQAIQQKDIPDFDNIFNWLKGTSGIQDIQLMEGEVTDENWDNIIRKVRSSVSGVGEASKQGNSFEWIQRFKEIGFRHISFIPENGRTKVQYVYKWTGLKFITGFFSFRFVFAIAVLALENSALPKAISILISIAVGGAGSFLNRFYLKPYFERKRKTMLRVMDEIRTELKKLSEPGITIQDPEVYQSDETDSTNPRERISS